MEENIFDTNVPSLTLDGATAAAEAPSESAASPELQSFDVKVKEAAAEVIDESMLTDAEKKVVDDFVKKIDIRDSTVVMQYGSAAQTKVSQFSDSTLEKVRTKDLGEIGDTITNLVNQLKGLSIDEDEKGIKSFFKRSSNKLSTMKTKYEKAEVNVDSICKVLQDHQVTLLHDIATLDKLYATNLDYQKELTMYIIAGKKKLKLERETTLSDLMKKAADSGLAEDAQAARDFSDLCDRFEKKLYDLELTRMISIQMAPQIRLIQNSDTMMVEKIQSTLVNTIPLWKSQMVIALGLTHASQAMDAQREVSNVTNELLKKNADALKTSTIEVAKESERGIVDMETLRHTNEQLVSTLEEVIRIQDDGRAKRRESEAELAKIEAELKQKLLDINTGKKTAESGELK
ncbi:MAG: toxic anion resistance protein [Firmicutes bacterium]|nr:toxic anion resistance protein [Bacillota bacterium]MCD7831649.1 toxic anion resistance protein [Bacillota bacterium]